MFANRIGWAKSYLRKAGLIDATRRGHFVISPAGMKLLESKPSRIDNKVLMQYESFRRLSPGSSGLEEVSTQAEAPLQNQRLTPDEVMRDAHKEIDIALAQDLLDRVRTAPPEFFERLIVDLLLSMGYGGSKEEAGRTLGKSGDDGVDGVIDQDALGLDRVYIQAKRYRAGNNIGSGAIRDFFGSLDRHKAAKGLFVTTSVFSPSAKETAEVLSKRIVLVDGALLAKLMIRHNVGCRVDDTFAIKKVDEDFFE